MTTHADLAKCMIMIMIGTGIETVIETEIGVVMVDVMS